MITHVHTCDDLPGDRSWAHVSLEYSEKWSEKLGQISSLRSRKDLAGIVHDAIGSDVLRESYGNIADTIFERAKEKEVDAIIELGSGWGVNLANIHLRGMKGMPMWALELTSAGRACTEELRRVDPTFMCLAMHFDYYEPERAYEELWRYDRALVFTCHSIEQIPFVTTDVFTGLIDRMNHVHAMHFEPVGWQMEANGGREAQARYSKLNGYNQNLTKVLQTLERDDRLAITRAEHDVSVVNPENPTMLVEWESR